MFPGHEYLLNNSIADTEDQYAYMAMGSADYYMYEPDGKLSGIDTAHKSGTKSGSRASQGAGNIAKRATNIDFGMGQNEGVSIRVAQQATSSRMLPCAYRL